MNYTNSQLLDYATLIQNTYNTSSANYNNFKFINSINHEHVLANVYNDGIGNYVIAIAGTRAGSKQVDSNGKTVNVPYPKKQMLSDLWADVCMIFRHIPKEFDIGMKITQYMEAISHQSITVVGHSLGGSCANWVARNNATINAVAFNAFGFEVKQGGISPNAVNYRIKGDIVSGIRLEYIKQPINTMQLAGSVLSNYNRISRLRFLDRLLYKHAIGTFIGLFGLMG